MRREQSALVLGILAALACERSESSPDVGVRPEREVEVVIARVGGELIGASDVAERMRTNDLDRDAALDSLVDEALLVDEARARGLTESEAQRRALERIMVRQMLKDFEGQLTPEKVPQEDVRTDFETHESKFQVPERRASWHILVRDTSATGKSLAESIRREVSSAREPREVFSRYEKGDVNTDLEVMAEELPAITRAAGFEKAYKDALFEAETRGLVDDVVETSFGWHVIVVTDITPGQARTLEDVEPEIRDRLSQKMRFQNLVRTVEGLEARGLVEYDEEGVDRLLSMSGLPKRRE